MLILVVIVARWTFIALESFILQSNDKIIGLIFAETHKKG
jgi:hypothetical protein